VATDWNPNLPVTAGVEWFPVEQGEFPLVAGAACATTIRSTVAEAAGTDRIDTIEVGLPIMSEQAATILAEVFVAGDEVPDDDVSTTTYRPNSDVLNQGDDWIRGTTSGGLGSIGTTALYQRVDEATLSADDWIAYFGTVAARRVYRFSVNAGAWPSDRRVVGGRVGFVVDREDQGGRFDVSYFDGTNSHYLGTVSVSTKRRRATVLWPEFNPTTDLPWTTAEIQNLGSAGTAAIQLRPRGVGKNKLMRIYQIWLDLDWIPENRVAVASTLVSPADDGDVVFSLRHPTTAVSNWSKQVGDYLLVLRRVGGVGVARWRWFEETPVVSEFLGRPDQNVAAPFETYHPVLDRRGFVSRLGDRIPGRSMHFVLRRLDTDISVDGQPYSELVGLEGDPETSWQMIRTGTAGDFGVEE
jgi:hypothetical protein